MTLKLKLGDSLEVLKKCPDNYVDSIVTDPPYGLSFMGKKWDYDVPSAELWKECLRVLKPGGHLLAFGGTRTYHRLVVAIEDAGFEIRDQIQWIYGQGFPKSQNIFKAITKEYECQLQFNVNLAEMISERTPLELREETTNSVLGYVVTPPEAGQGRLTVIGKVVDSNGQTVTFQYESDSETCLNTDTLWNSTLDDPSNPGRKYITETKLETITGLKILSLLPKLNMLATTCGLGSALKPANEPICLARKPLSESTLAKNVLKHGTGGLNIDGSRIDSNGEKIEVGRQNRGSKSTFQASEVTGEATEFSDKGRFPANVLFDEDAAKVLDEQSGVSKSQPRRLSATENANIENEILGKTGKRKESEHNDSGGASRFFYVAKASKSDRGEGNTHPTVKPIKLMEYLIKLITPPNGIVLDPFMGSGSTGVAAKRLGFGFVGVELSPEYFEIAKQRIEGVKDGSE